MQITRGRIFFWIAALAASPAFAQSLSAPVEGFVFDPPSQSLRAINGFPGSATMGPALIGGIEFGSPAPHQKYAVALRSGHPLAVANLGASPVTTISIAGIFGRPDDARWTEDGTQVTVFSRSGHWIQTIAGMPHKPHANSHLDLSVLGGSLANIAVDKTGKQIAIAMSGASGGVYLNTETQQFIPLAKMANPVALSFSEDGTSLYALDANGRLSAIHLSDWSSHLLPLSGLHHPFDLRFGHDATHGPLIYLVSHGDRMLGVYAAAGEKLLEKIHLNFDPSGLEDLGSNSFVIASRTKPADPLWLFSTVPHPAVYFVPAPASGKGAD